MRRLQLEMRIGSKTIKSWSLSTNNEYIIGRSSDSANICIEHSSLSRNHAKISVSASGSAVIQDLNSKNGTLVDGKQITSNQIVLLRVGTQLQLGDHPQNFLISETFVEAPSAEKEISEAKKTKKHKERSRSRSSSREKEKEKDQQENHKHEHKIKTFERISGKKEKHNKERNFEKEKGKEKEKEQMKSNAKIKKSLLWNKPVEAKPPSTNLNNMTLQSLDANFNEKLKFLKLMGVKSDDNLRELLPEKAEDDKLKEGVKIIINKQEHMKEDLEKQFNAGMQRKDGRKVGLGYSN